MRKHSGEILIFGARAGFLALVVFAAADFGLTRTSGIATFNAAMGALTLVWLIGCTLAWARPNVGAVPLTICLGILAIGWLSAGAAALEIAMSDVEDIPDWLDSVFLHCAASHADLAWAAMTRTTALLAAFIMALDMFAAPRWGKGLLVTLGLTGFAMVTFVFLQKMTGSLLLLSAEDGRTPLTFGTYRYWGNAASFLNLTWPVLAAIAVHTGIRQARGWSLWMAAAIATFSGLYINTSKAGHVLGLVGLLLLGALLTTALFRTRRISLQSVPWPVIATSGLAALFLGAALFHGIKWSRWEYLANEGWENNPRPQAYERFVKILPDAGWNGFGPGNFQRVYGRYVRDLPLVKRTPFWVAHQDYIQTIVEWGWGGAALWAALLGPAGAKLAARSFGGKSRRSNRNESETDYEFDWRDKIVSAGKSLPSPTEPVVQAAAFTAVILTALHASVDFPMQIQSLQFYFLIWVALGWQPLAGVARRSVPAAHADEYRD